METIEKQIVKCKVEIFDLLRKIEGMQNMVNQVSEAKQKKLKELLDLEASLQKNVK